MERGRTENRTRAASPEYHTSNRRSRAHSPAGSFYHDRSPGPIAIPYDFGVYWPNRRESDANSDSSWQRPDREPAADPDPSSYRHYQHSFIANTEIRLLRIDPGTFTSDLSCALKIVTLEKLANTVHAFQALSYAWGTDLTENRVYMTDLPRSRAKQETVDSTRRIYFVRSSLYHALKHVRDTDDYVWLWCDAMCIDQKSRSEKSRQIPLMPQIYSSAWNVIAWLGHDEFEEGDIERAAGLIPILLNLKMLDSILREHTADDGVLQSWVSFGRLIKRPWFKRRWVIQEVACARRLALRIANRIISWQDFSDAVDLYLANVHRIQIIYRRSTLYSEMPTALYNIEDSEAATLMRLSRNVFRKSSDSTVMSRDMNLESLVSMSSSFAVSNIRDVIYALLFLANDPLVFVPDYSKSSALVLVEFTRYFIETSKSLDIICRPWANWPRPTRYHLYEGMSLPTWIGVASFGKDGHPQRLVSEGSLLGPTGIRAYDACRGAPIPAPVTLYDFWNILPTEGVILGRVEEMSPIMNGRILHHYCLQTLGWDGNMDDGIDDRLWRSLVANRDPHGNTAPTWYRRACALAMTKLDDEGNLHLADLCADESQSNAMIKYLRRVQDATRNRRIFRCAKPVLRTGDVDRHGQESRGVVGLGPLYLDLNDPHWVCILFGCSVPVMVTRKRILEDDPTHAFLVGACYVHGNMEGEMFAGMSKEEIKRRSGPFNIH